MKIFDEYQFGLVLILVLHIWMFRVSFSAEFTIIDLHYVVESRVFSCRVLDSSLRQVPVHRTKFSSILKDSS